MSESPRIVAFPMAETLVASVDPASGLYLPVKEVIVTSLTNALWRSPKQFGPLFTAVASPVIPAKHVFTLHTWPLLVEARIDPAPHFAVLRRASLRAVAGYKRHFPDLEGEVLSVLGEIILEWSRRWTMAEAFAHLHDGYFAALPSYVERHMRDLLESAQAAKRVPRNVAGQALPILSLTTPIRRRKGDPSVATIADTVGTVGDRTRWGEVELFRQEAQIERRLILDLVDKVADPALRRYLEIRRTDWNVTHAEASRAVGRSTVTMWNKLRQLREQLRRGDL